MSPGSGQHEIASKPTDRRSGLISTSLASGNRRHAGATLKEALVVLAIVGIAPALVLPAVSKSRDDQRIAQCAANLKQLAAAAHQYANDFKGLFFRARWYGEAQVGRYLPYHRNGDSPDREASGNVLHSSEHGDGLIVGLMLCPSDATGSVRSYGMNYWASRQVAAEPHGRDDPELPSSRRFFDSNDPKIAQLLLFTDAVSAQPSPSGWVSPGLIGLWGLPGERFGGPRLGGGFYMLNDPIIKRFRVASIATELDYIRHGENEDRHLAKGAVNIAYGDGHVSLAHHAELYTYYSPMHTRRDRATAAPYSPPIVHPVRSTYNVLWSPSDRSIEEKALGLQ